MKIELEWKVKIRFFVTILNENDVNITKLTAE